MESFQSKLESLGKAQQPQLSKYSTSASHDFYDHSEAPSEGPAALPLSVCVTSFLGAVKQGECPASFAAQSSFASHACR